MGSWQAVHSGVISMNTWEANAQLRILSHEGVFVGSVASFLEDLAVQGLSA